MEELFLKLPELKIGNKIAKVPIIQGGMAVRLSTARLAAAVANEGGIGLIAASGMPTDELRYEIRLARSLTSGIIGINIMVAARGFSEIVKTAIEEGIVAGGGVAYIRAIESLDGLKGENDDETTGIAIIKRAIEEPLRQIVANAGKEGAVVVQKVSEGKGDFGYNARTDVYENLHAAGVVDPAKVTRVALENAASIAGMFLTTECVIVEKKEDKPEMPMGAPGMGGMGGMM